MTHAGSEWKRKLPSEGSLLHSGGPLETGVAGERCGPCWL